MTSKMRKLFREDLTLLECIENFEDIGISEFDIYIEGCMLNYTYCIGDRFTQYALEFFGDILNSRIDDITMSGYHTCQLHISGVDYDKADYFAMASAGYVSVTTSDKFFL